MARLTHVGVEGTEAGLDAEGRALVLHLRRDSEAERVGHLHADLSVAAQRGDVLPLLAARARDRLGDGQRQDLDAWQHTQRRMTS